MSWVNPERFFATTKGENSTHPKHSIEAYQHEHELGQRHFETDVRVTKDNHLVSVHSVFGTVGWRRVSSLTLEQILDRQPCITTTDVLLNEFPDVNWNFEAKGQADARQLVLFLQQSGELSRRRVCVSFGWAHRHVAEIRSMLDPEVSTMATVVEQLQALYFKRVPPCDIVQLPHFLIPFSRAHASSGFFSSFPEPVLLWGSTRRSKFNEAKELGADGVITSAAQTVTEFLAHLLQKL
jgi:glycerophosphoryl diester phosphodiesterase